MQIKHIATGVISMFHDVFPNVSNPSPEWLLAQGYEFYTPDPEPQPPAIPQTIRMAQALVYLENKGLREQVEAAVAGMGTIAQIRFQREVNCNRYDELVLGIQQLLGWTDAEMDTMFTEADSAPLT